MASTSFVPPPAAWSYPNDDLPEARGESSSSSSSSADILSEWPALGTGNGNNKNDERGDGEWELVSPSAEASAATPVVTFDPEIMSQPKPMKLNPKMLHPSRSSPDLRAWNRRAENQYEDERQYDEYGDEESSSAVLVDESDTAGSASLVSEPPSVWSIGSKNVLSFKDAILRKPIGESLNPKNAKNNTSLMGPAKKTVKTTFVVVQPSGRPQKTHLRRNSQSMGNLRALDHIQEDMILGETDASDFYCRKAKGAAGHVNGKKTRPDEAKRLQITMAKKKLQQQRQGKKG